MVKHLRKVYKSIDLQGQRKLIAYADGPDFIEREAIVVPRRGGPVIDSLSQLDAVFQIADHVHADEAIGPF